MDNKRKKTGLEYPSEAEIHPPEWVEHLITLVPDFDIVYTGNDWTEKCFKNYKKRKFKVKKIKLIPGLNSTTIRNRILNRGTLMLVFITAPPINVPKIILTV